MIPVASSGSYVELQLSVKLITAPSPTGATRPPPKRIRESWDTSRAHPKSAVPSVILTIAFLYSGETLVSKRARRAKAKRRNLIRRRRPRLHVQDNVHLQRYFQYLAKRNRI